MKFILTRHGQKQKVNTDSDALQNAAGLSEIGISQIEKLAQTLKIEFPDLLNQERIFASNLPRSVQSAEILRNILEIKKIQVETGLVEFYGTKKYSLPESEREELNKYAILNPDFVPVDVGISFNQELEIFEKTLRSIASSYNQNHILIAGHSLISRYFIYKYAPELTPKPEEISETRLNAGSYSVVNFDGTTFKLEKFNIY
jgi:broad specificity phosphatase PhoE